MPCNLELYPLEFPAVLSTTGADAIALEVKGLQRTAEAVAISILQNQRTYGYAISMLQDAIGGGGLNALMPLTIISNTTAFVPTAKGSKGFWGGGLTYGSLSVSYIDRFTFLDKSVSRMGITFAKKRTLAATIASRSNAYWAGGSISDIDRLVFSTEAITTIGILLGVNQVAHLVGLTSLLAGYVVAGTGVDLSAAIQKFIFTTEAVTLLGAVLTAAVWGHAGVGSLTAGYTAGGYITASIATIHKFLYSTEAVSLMGNSLSTPRRNLTGLSSDSAGYFAAGLGTTGYVGTGLPLSSIEKLTYSGEAMTVLGSAFGAAHWVSDGLGNNVNGYVGGGVIRDANGVYISLRTISELSYIGDSLTLLGIGLSDSRYGASAISDFSPGMGL